MDVVTVHHGTDCLTVEREIYEAYLDDHSMTMTYFPSCIAHCYLNGEEIDEIMAWTILATWRQEKVAD